MGTVLRCVSFLGLTTSLVVGGCSADSFESDTSGGVGGAASNSASMAATQASAGPGGGTAGAGGGATDPWTLEASDVTTITGDLTLFDAISDGRDGVILAANYEGVLGTGEIADAIDGLVLGLDDTLEPSWLAPGTGPWNDHVLSVAPLPRGQVAVAGYFGGSFTLGGAVASASGPFDVYVAKVAPQVDPPTAELFTFGDEGENRGWEKLAAAADGSLALFANISSGSVAFGAEAEVASDANDSRYGVFLTLLDPELQGSWLVELADVPESLRHLGDVAIDDNHDVFVATSFDQYSKIDQLEAQGIVDGQVASFDAFGELRWTAHLQPSPGARVEIEHMTLSQGRLWIAGAFGGTLKVGTKTAMSAGELDGFLLSLDPETGVPDVLAAYGATGFDRLTCVLPRADDTVLVAGTFEHGLALPNELPSRDGKNAFVAALDAAAAPLGAVAFAGDFRRALLVGPAESPIFLGDFTGTAAVGGALLESGAEAHDILAVRLDIAPPPR